jgi:ABC-type transport system involved in cytochrome c biogenesis permease subunit
MLKIFILNTFCPNRQTDRNAAFPFRALPFWLSVALMAVMAATTVAEKFWGSDFAYRYVYGAWWFVYLWALLAVLGLIGLVKGKLYRNPALLLLHLSFVVILVGALCTRMLAQQGRISVTRNVYNSVVQGDGHDRILPFSVRLDTFYITTYPGTDAPADYTSRISILDKSGDATEAQVSMNRIFTYRGYRFYQSSYGDDLGTSILRVNYDVVGTPVTYAGYALFALAMLWFLLSPQNAFRQLLRHPLLRRTALAAALLLSVGAGRAQTVTRDSLTVEKTQSDAFCDIWTLNGGRIMPLFTLAHDFTLKVLGTTSFGSIDANRFFMSMLFLPDKWYNIPIFEVANRQLAAELNLKGSRASISDFYDLHGNYKLGKYWNAIASRTAKTELLKEAEKLNDRIQLIEMLYSGELLQVCPVSSGGAIRWLHPAQQALSPDEQQHIDFIRTALTDYYTALIAGDSVGALAQIDAIKRFQQTHAGAVLPSAAHRRAEKMSVMVNFNSLLFKINLTAGLLALLSLLAFGARRQRRLNTLFYVVLIVAFLVHSFAVGLRAYIAGRLPFSNGYETMLIVAWCALLIAALFGRRIAILVPFGLLLSGSALLVAHISSMNPQITPLMPVLSSPLLSIHVSTLILAYTLLGFVALNSLMSIASLFFMPTSKAADTLQLLERNRVYSLVCLYPAIFLLGAGIFIGAVWANISWGRYWGWDPKEVWALVTFMLYTLVLHRQVRALSGVFAFHAFGLLSFLSVLMTYFGVNCILGGMHSYAGDMQTHRILLIALVVVVALTVFVVAGYRKYLINKSNEKVFTT